MSYLPSQNGTDIYSFYLCIIYSFNFVCKDHDIDGSKSFM